MNSITAPLSRVAHVATLALVISVFPKQAATAKPLDQNSTGSLVSCVTTLLLEKSLGGRTLDDAMAREVLARHLDELDPERNLFLLGDVEELERGLAGWAAKLPKSGDTELARRIFARYTKRLEQRASFAADMLQKSPWTAGEKDVYHFDRAQAERPASEKAARKLWAEQLHYEFLGEQLRGTADDRAAKLLRWRWSFAAETARKTSDKDIIEGLLKSLAATYDPHSRYIAAPVKPGQRVGIAPRRAGIGAVFEKQDDFLTLTRLAKDGTVDRERLLRQGDRLLAIRRGTEDNFTSANELTLNELNTLLTGKAGEQIFLKVIPAGAREDEAEVVNLTLEPTTFPDTRAKARVVEIMDDGETHRIGVIRLPSFYRGQRRGTPYSAASDVEALLDWLSTQKIAGVVLDLRHNGGGSFLEAVELVGLFIPTGAVAQVSDLTAPVQVGRDNDPKVAYDGPLVVLTNRVTASAAELTAGALQDLGRAVVVGDSSTFGKGTAQAAISVTKVIAGKRMQPAWTPGFVDMTRSQVFRITGKSTQLKGVQPDVVIPSLTDFPSVAEASYPNALPWKTIAAAEGAESRAVDNAKLKQLRQSSTQRVSENQAFKAIVKEHARMRELQASGCISLHRPTREAQASAIAARTQEVDKAFAETGAQRPIVREIGISDLSQGAAARKLTYRQAALSQGTGIPIEIRKDLSLAEDFTVLFEAGRILLDYVSLPINQ